MIGKFKRVQKAWRMVMVNQRFPITAPGIRYIRFMCSLDPYKQS